MAPQQAAEAQPPLPLPSQYPSLVIPREVFFRVPFKVFLYVRAGSFPDVDDIVKSVMQGSLSAKCFREGERDDTGGVALKMCPRCQTDKLIEVAGVRETVGPETLANGTVFRFTFDQCRSYCSSSRLHLRANLVLGLVLKHGGPCVVYSNPFALMSKIVKRRSSKAPARSLAQVRASGGAAAGGGNPEDDENPEDPDELQQQQLAQQVQPPPMPESSPGLGQHQVLQHQLMGHQGYGMLAASAQQQKQQQTSPVSASAAAAAAAAAAAGYDSRMLPGLSELLPHDKQQQQQAAQQQVQTQQQQVAQQQNQLQFQLMQLQRIQQIHGMAAAGGQQQQQQQQAQQDQDYMKTMQLQDPSLLTAALNSIYAVPSQQGSQPPQQSPSPTSAALQAQQQMQGGQASPTAQLRQQFADYDQPDPQQQQQQGVKRQLQDPADAWERSVRPKA
eukprot:m51a1_g345 hypothetical protein (445) ;mRNA; f:537202-539079